MTPKHLALTLAIGLVLAVTAACQQAAAPVEELKAGIGIPLSGTSATIGIMYGRTYDMVAEDIGVFEVAGKKYKWTINKEDNLYTSQGGVQSANKFINQLGVKFVYQLGSAPGNAVQPVAEAAKVLYDAASSDRAFLGPKNKYSFRSYTPPADTYPATIAYLKKNMPQLKNWHILTSDDASGAAVTQSTEPIIAKNGLNLVGKSTYPRETTDFYPVLVKVLPTKPDVIITMSADAVGTLIKQARENGYTSRFLISTMAPKIAEIAGVKNAEGTLVPDPDMWSDQSPKVLAEIGKKYKGRYGEDWNGNGRSPFPTLFLITDAMKKAGTVDDVDKIVKTMETEKLNTPFGPMFYGGEKVYGIPHQLVWPVWISEFKDGKLTTIATVSAEDAAKAVEEVFK